MEDSKVRQQQGGRFDDACCAAKAISALVALIGSFWMAGILF